MTPEEFVENRKHLNMTQTELAEALGLGKSTIQLYERGKRHEDDRPVEIPKTVRLALAALFLGVTDFSTPE